MTIAEHVKRRREDLGMYWRATRFLWRVFTHPRTPKTGDPAGRPVAAPYRMFTKSAVPARQVERRGLR
jgi:hypothetical protein